MIESDKCRDRARKDQGRIARGRCKHTFEVFNTKVKDEGDE